MALHRQKLIGHLWTPIAPSIPNVFPPIQIPVTYSDIFKKGSPLQEPIIIQLPQIISSRGKLEREVISTTTGFSSFFSCLMKKSRKESRDQMSVCV